MKQKGPREAYEALGPQFDFIEMMIEARLKKGLTQAALAKRLGTKQSAIARLESGDSNPTLDLLRRVAKALDANLVISMPQKKA